MPPNLGSDLRSLYNGVVGGGRGAGWPTSVKESIVRPEGLVLHHFLAGRAAEQGTWLQTCSANQCDGGSPSTAEKTFSWRPMQL